MLSVNRLVHLALATALLASSPVVAAARDRPDQPLDIKELNKSGKPPKAIKRDPPIYPLEIARAGLIGAVTVEFVIDTEGNVRNAYVVESNNPWFERPAVDAIMGWKFQPGEQDGRRVNTRVKQRMEFNLQPGGKTPDLWRIAKSKDHDKLPPEFQWNTPPMPVNTLFPVYPFDQLEAGVAGKAMISCIVGPDGRVHLAKVHEASAPEFGLAVLAMIDAWRFKPAQKKDGTPAYANLGMQYEFRPKGRGDVPVSDEARDILRNLAKNPGAIATGNDLDQPLKPLSRRSPVFPTALKEAGRDGEAQIEFFVDRNGDVQLPRVISGSAPEFGYAAAQAVATWRFEVPRKAGKPVVVRAQIPIEFSLSAGKPALKK